LRLVAYMLVLF